MRSLYKYLSQYKVKLGCCLFVLLCQTAFCLIMPFLMGNFINVGIQQKGIEETVPYVMSQETLALFEKILPQEKFETFKSNYEYSNLAPENTPEYLQDAIDGYFIKGDADIDEVRNIYGNAVISALIFLQQYYPEFTDVDIDAMYNYVSLTYISEKIEDKTIEPQILDELYASAEKNSEMVKTQISSMLLSYVYDDAGVDLEETEREYVIKYGIYMLLCTIGQIGCMLFVHFKASDIASDVEKDLRNSVIKHSHKFGKSEFSKISPEEIATALTFDVDRIGMIVNYFIKFFMYAPFLAIGGAVISLSKNFIVGLLIVLTSVVIVVALFIVYKLTIKKYEIMNFIYNKLSKLYKTNIEQVLTIRSLDTEKIETQKAETFSNEYKSNESFVLKSVFLALSIINLITNAVIAVVVILSGDSLTSSSLNLGDMIAFVQYALLTVSAFMMVGAIVVFAPQAMIAINHVENILSLDIKVKNIGKSQNSHNNWSIKFENVSINIPTENNFSFEIPMGKKVAIIGPTGCGKTSLMDLLLMRDLPLKGQIYIGDEKLDDIDINVLREKISYLQGTGVLFTKTIRENLMLYGCENNDAVMKNALKIAECGFLPENSLDYMIMNGGSNFSGGQKSRMAIAGAVAKNAELYIFDDCFTALDKKKEEKILENLLKDKANATVVIISQSIKSIMNCDMIIVLSKTGVEAVGSHKELMKMSPYYQKVVNNQASEVTANG